MDWKNRRLVGNLYMDQNAGIKIDDEFPESGVMGGGVEQWCPLL